MTRLALAFAFVAATSSAAFADEPPTDGGTTPTAAAAPATPAPPKAKNVPPFQFDQAKISGDNPHLPDAVKARYAKAGKAVGIYKICVDSKGDVSSFQTVQSIPGGDEAVMATVRTWKFKPQVEPICSVSRFMFMIDR